MSTVGKLSREEWRKQKDLDAARKAGTAPAEIGEDGEVINPHVPDYMSKAPWYLDTGKRSLKHQRKPETGEKFAGINDWYQRGVKEGPAATKYRKGACENCGATSHKTRDCLERPRKKGAKWTNKDIAPDEYVADLGDKKLDFAAKRDRWNGYDPAEHKRIMEEYEAVEEERRRLREEEIDKQTSTDISAAKKIAKKDKSKAAKTAKDDADFSSEDDEDEDEDKYAEAANMAGQKVDTDNRMSIRNLRIREDRAKYLYNLNPDSAYYDPKTRSMREAPDANVRPEDSQFAGDNYHRAKGDAVAMQRLQLFAWQAEARGNDVHLQANPTVNEKQFREFQEKKEKLRESTRGSILDKYGGAEHFDSVPKELLQGQTENYVEYSRAGQIIKGQERAKAKSRFEEDVYDNNHTAVWGSWYDLTTGQWGYKCCHSTISNSYCTGQAGIEASRASAAHAAPPAQTSAATTTTETSAKGKGKERAEEKAAPAEEATAGSKRRRRASVSSAASSASSRSFSGSDSDFSATDSDSDAEDRRRSRRRSGSGRHGRSSRRDSTSKRSRRSRRRSYSSSRSGSGSDSESGSESDDGARRRHKSSKSRSGKTKTATGYVSRKHLGEGDVSARLDKAKLKAALAHEDARHGGAGKDKGEGKDGGKDKDKKAAKPDWLLEAEMINAGKVLGGKVRPSRGGEGDDAGEAEEADVTEEQMEAYRLKSRNAYEDPMANYRDEEEHEGAA